MSSNDHGWTIVGASGRAVPRSLVADEVSLCHKAQQIPAMQNVLKSSNGKAATSGGGLPGLGADHNGRRSQQRQPKRVAQVTPEQQLEHLVALVRECRAEVKGSLFYQQLSTVLALASGVAASAARPGLVCSRQHGTGLAAGMLLAEGGPAPAVAARLAMMDEMIIYGLGSPEGSHVSRYQLALALLLAERHLPALAQSRQRPLAYDPAFTDLDHLLLARLGVDIIQENEGGARRASSRGGTFFFMPHCEGVLCDSLLGANWAEDQLPCLAILGNSFSTYFKRWSLKGAGSTAATRSLRPGRLLQLVEADVVQQMPTPDCGFSAASAFNDMSLHLFQPEQCQLFFSSLNAVCSA